MTAYVYRCYEAGGQLAYVGASRNAINRLVNHRTASWWAHRIAHVDIRVFPDMAAARAVERQAIREEHPRWNVMGRWATSCTWTEQQFRDYWFALIHQAPSGSAQRKKHITHVEDRFALIFGKSIRETAVA